MKIAEQFKAIFRQKVDAFNAERRKRRPLRLDLDEAIDGCCNAL